MNKSRVRVCLILCESYCCLLSWEWSTPIRSRRKKTETRMFAVSNMKVINQEKGNGEEIGDRMLELVQIIVPTAKE